MFQSDKVGNVWRREGNQRTDVAAALWGATLDKGQN